jgi:hypothetical protein
MSPDEIKNRIVNEIKARAYDDKYVDRGEEREIVQIAIQLGGTVEIALTALVQVCAEFDYTLESQITKQIKEAIAKVVVRDGLIEQKEFDAIFAEAKKVVQSRKNDREVKKMIVAVMEETGNNKIKRGWFSNWYASLKQELGM